MGIVFSGMFGLGLVIFTKVDTDQHLMHILFGNVLGVTIRGPDRDRDRRRRHAARGSGSSGAICCSTASIPTTPAPSACRCASCITGCWCLLSLTIVARAEGGRHHPR